MSYVVAVEFAIRPDAWEDFKPLMLENARASLRDEKGCRQFDVCAPPDGSPRVFLYEIYDDEAAFKAHLETAHFKNFAERTKEMIEHRAVTVWRRL